MSLSLVLADDPVRRVPFDLVRTLRGCPARFEWRIEPAAEASQPRAAEGSQPPAAADALAAACMATAGSPVVLPQYRARGTTRAADAGRTFAAAQTAEALAGLAGPRFVLVVFVSRTTLPLVEALHADSRTRGLLRIGITGWRLDPDYNLAQKLVAQGKLDYHEHAMTLERTFCRRLERMLDAHAARDRGADPAREEEASAPPAGAETPAQTAPPTGAETPAQPAPPTGAETPAQPAPAAPPAKGKAVNASA